MKKILLVSAYDAPFVKRDIEILRKKYLVEESWGNKRKKTFWNYLLVFLKTGSEVSRNKIVYCWFADYRAHCAVWWSRLFKRKSVVIIGGYEMQTLFNIKHSNHGSITLKHLLYCIKKANKIVAVSDDNLMILTGIFPKQASKMIRIYNAVTIPQSQDIVVSKENIVLTVCKGDDPKRIMVKGLDVFISAAKHLQRYKFAIIGTSGSLRDKLQEMIDSDNVILLDEMHEIELTEWYKKAKVYCQFSRMESFGLSLVEAMSWGCFPVVSPIKSLIERIGENGLIIERFDGLKASKVILEAANKNRRTKQKVFDWVKDNYDVSKRAESIVGMLEELMES